MKVARFFDTRYTYLYNNCPKLSSEIVYSIFQLSFISYWNRTWHITILLEYVTIRDDFTVRKSKRHYSRCNDAPLKSYEAISGNFMKRFNAVLCPNDATLNCVHHLLDVNFSYVNAGYIPMWQNTQNYTEQSTKASDVPVFPSKRVLVDTIR